MSIYATTADVAAGYRELTDAEQTTCQRLLDEAEIMIDALASGADSERKGIVACRIVRRALASIGQTGTIPMGATTGSQTAGPYSQSWSISNGSTGQLYLDRQDKMLLGLSGRIGSRSPLEDVGVTT